MPLANSKKGARAITKFQQEAVKPALAQLLHNEQVMQAKFRTVDDWCEAMAETVTSIGDEVTQHRYMTLWQRLRWIVRGEQ